MVRRPPRGTRNRSGAQQVRFLVVEDERDLAQTLRRVLEEEDFAVDIAEDGEDGLFKIREMPYDAVILDLMLPRLDGWIEQQRLWGVYEGGKVE